MRLLVTATNPDGAGSRASAATATVQAAPPVNTALPVVTGAALRGTTLSASPGTWSGPGSASPTSGSTTPAPGSRTSPARPARRTCSASPTWARRVRIRVTATNADASVSATSLGLERRARAGRRSARARRRSPARARRTSTLTSTPGVWSGIENDYAYQWQRRTTGTVHGHRRRDRHDLHARVRGRGRADPAAGHRHQPRRHGQRGQRRDGDRRRGRAEQHRRSRPSRGAAKLNATLTAAPGDWTPGGADFAYVWQRDGVDIPGATRSTYTLRPADVGKIIRVKVTATNVDGSAERDLRRHRAGRRAAREHGRARRAVGHAAGGVHAHGRRRAPGTPRARSFAYTWLRCAADATAITAGCEEAGTGSTYTLSAADVGRRLGVRVSASSSGGTTHGRQRADRHGRRLVLRNLDARPASPAPRTSGRRYGDAGRWTFPSADADLRLAALRRGRHLQLRVGRRRVAQYALSADDAGPRDRARRRRGDARAERDGAERAARDPGTAGPALRSSPRS